MKRRVLTLVMALVLLVGMVPVTAFAASDFVTSDAGVDLIKYFEGFSEKPYWDYKQYTVGYGTRCPDDMLEEYMERGITEEEAEALLQEELKGFESSLNTFIDKYDLTLTQQQFDALLSLTYNCGAGWTSGASTQLFTQYVIAGKTGNDFLFAIAQWSTAGGSTNLGLIKRRLIEANLYLNGVYSTSVPENYDYVLFNHTSSIYEGKSRSVRVQGYDSDLTDAVRPVGTKDGYRFLGWYTASTGGEWITTLTAKQAGKTLYAHWQKDEGNVDSSGNILGTEASYDRTASGTLKIYAQPSQDAKTTGTIAKGTVMSIVADYVDADGVKWGLLEQGGWVCLTAVASEEPETPTEPPVQEEKVIATGTVKISSGTLNVRAGAGTSYEKVGSLANGSRVEIYEIVTVSGTKWGRISSGWISLDYVVLDEAGEEPEETVPEETVPEETVPEETVPEEPVPEETVVGFGTVNTSSGSINIRSGAGTSYSKVGSLSKGEEVEIYEIVNVSGTRWGRIADGWISLSYVKLASAGMVKSGVNIRSGAGTSYSKVGSYKKGTVVFVTETKQVGSITWGHTDAGWINVSYLNMASTGTVTANSVNVRSGAGASYAKVGSYKKNAVINVYETTKVGSATWGHTDLGWLNLSYVRMEAAPVSGTITANSLNIRSGAGSGYAVVGSYKKGDAVKVYETTKVGSITWGRTDLGWVNMAYVQVGGAVRTGTVTGNSVNVRKGAGAGYAKVGTVKSGDKLTITALKLVSGSAWGKISSGWVCLDYVKMDKPANGSPALIMGDDLNIRKGAGKSYSVVGQYDKGVVVTILQTKTVSSVLWGRTDKGWVSMDYVL